MRHKSNHFFHSVQEQVLFDTAQYVKRPKPNQKEFEELILPYIPILERHSHKQHLNYGSYMRIILLIIFISL